MFAWLFHLVARGKVAAPATPSASVIPAMTLNIPIPSGVTPPTATVNSVPQFVSGLTVVAGSWRPAQSQTQDIPAKAEESIMATAPVTPTPASTENGFERFIDKLESFVSAELPIATEVAVVAEPILALTPIGPEYALVVTAIAAAEKASAAFKSKTGVALTGTQKMSLVVQAAAPTLTATLTAAGVTDAAIPTAIGQFAQNVYNFQTGPAVSTPAAPAPTPAD